MVRDIRLLPTPEEKRRGSRHEKLFLPIQLHGISAGTVLRILCQDACPADKPHGASCVNVFTRCGDPGSAVIAACRTHADFAILQRRAAPDPAGRLACLLQRR
jgi:hypothetical protein